MFTLRDRFLHLMISFCSFLLVKWRKQRIISKLAQTKLVIALQLLTQMVINIVKMSDCDDNRLNHSSST